MCSQRGRRKTKRAHARQMFALFPERVRTSRARSDLSPPDPSHRGILHALPTGERISAVRSLSVSILHCSLRRRLAKWGENLSPLPVRRNDNGAMGTCRWTPIMHAPTAGGPVSALYVDCSSPLRHGFPADESPQRPAAFLTRRTRASPSFSSKEGERKVDTRTLFGISEGYSHLSMG